jgi:cysteinyl-tRNA synthetase
MVMRLWVLSSHYRSIIDYSPVALKQAEVNLQKITDWINNLKNISPENSADNPEVDFSHIYRERFEQAMNDDLNTPLALSVVYELITETNKLIAEKKLSSATAKNILDFWERINKVLGLKIKTTIKIKKYKFKEDKLVVAVRDSEKVPEEVIKLTRERGIARNNKDFKKSDELREEIEKAGYIVKDLKDNEYKITKK